VTRHDGGDPIPMEELTESYRFDNELAAVLTKFQYHEDDITLTAAEPRPLPAAGYTAATAGLEAVFDSSSSLVFVCYDDRNHQMVNPIEVALSQAIATAVQPQTGVRSDGGTKTGSKQSVSSTPDPAPDSSQTGNTEQEPLSFGVVTPHNAQRGALETRLPESITANTVEKYQGGERDIITVSATVSDPEFARREEQFILNPNRLLVAISRSRLLTVVVCSTTLFEIAPKESEQLADGPVWARLFTQAVGRDATPAWAGTLEEFVTDSVNEHAGVPVRVYPSAGIEGE